MLHDITAAGGSGPAFGRDGSSTASRSPEEPEEPEGGSDEEECEPPAGGRQPEEKEGPSKSAGPPSANAAVQHVDEAGLEWHEDRRGATGRGR